jgi:hypothetical protein
METPAAAMETPAAAMVANDHGDITIDAVDAGVGAHLEQPSTPKPKPSPSLVVSCKELVIFFCKELVVPSLLLIQFDTYIGHKLYESFEAYGWNDL